MTQVIRMENDQRNGPFTPPWPYTVSEFKQHVPWVNTYELDSGQEALAPDDTHPHHNQDILERVLDPTEVMLSQLFGFQPEPPNGDWRTATTDREQLLHWFPKESLDWFDSLGYHIAVYDVPDNEVLRGKYQVLFNIDKAKLVKAEPASKFAKE